MVSCFIVLTQWQSPLTTLMQNTVEPQSSTDNHQIIGHLIKSFIFPNDKEGHNFCSKIISLNIIQTPDTFLCPESQEFGRFMSQMRALVRGSQWGYINNNYERCICDYFFLRSSLKWTLWHVQYPWCPLSRVSLQSVFT